MKIPDEFDDAKKEQEQSPYHQAFQKLADLIVEKQAAYGDSFSKSEQIMNVLYPDGIKPDQYRDALAMIRVIDKQFRIATRKDAFGESPWKDIAGYAGLSMVKDEE